MSGERARRGPSRREALAGAASLALAAWPRAGGARQQAPDVRAGEPIYSESVYLDGVGDDGSVAFVLRIGRFPDARRAWLWGHVFHPRHGVLAFTDHQAPDGRAHADVDAEYVRYEGKGEGGATLTLARRGDRYAPASAEAEARLPVRAANGALLLAELVARFEPRHASFRSLTGRSEVLGQTRATIRVAGDSFELDGRGHFHEQSQETPRFTTPFVYATLRGESASMIGILSPAAVRGFAVGAPGSAPVAIGELEISPPGDERSLRVRLTDGRRELAGTLKATYRYRNRIFDVERQASVVRGRLGDAAISGCVNDFLGERIRYR